MHNDLKYFLFLLKIIILGFLNLIINNITYLYTTLYVISSIKARTHCVRSLLIYLLAILRRPKRNILGHVMLGILLCYSCSVPTLMLNLTEARLYCMT